MRALDRVLAVLEAITAAGGEATMRELAARTGLTLPTVSRLVHDMTDVGILVRADQRSPYRFGPRLLALAIASPAQGNLLEVALPVMRELRDSSQETVSLHIRAGAHRVCIAQFESQQQVRRVVSVGLSMPLHTLASGRALLAHLPIEDREAILRNLGALDGPLVEDLKAIQRQGYAMASDALIEGVAGIAAPVCEARGAVAVISVSGPSFRWTEARMREFAPTLVTAARAVSDALRPSR